MNFTHYLQSLNLSSITIKEYTRVVNLFISWNKNDDMIIVEKKDILSYLSYLKNKKKIQPVSMNHALIGLRHYFDNLIKQELVSINPTSLIKLRGIKKRRLKYMYNPDELTQLGDNFYQVYVKTAEERKTTDYRKDLYEKSYYAQLRNYMMLQLIIYQGLTTREVLQLKITDIELQKASITIASGTQRGKARNLPLHATQIGTLLQYMHQVRPQLYGKESDILFLPTQQGNEKGYAKRALIQLVKSIKKIDTNFSSLAQIRASLITYWIQTYGLRKAQYLAGHKSINSTEEYLPNLIEDLAEDITKFNPF
jgi:site-specific recombinase XerD